MDDELEPEDESVRDLIRRQLIATGCIVMMSILVQVMMDLRNEESTLRFRVRWYQHRVMRWIDGRDHERAIALMATRGIACTEAWLARRFVESQHKKGPTLGNS